MGRQRERPEESAFSCLHHPKKWIENSIGKDTLDAQFIAQPYWKDQCTFQNGISKSHNGLAENHDLQCHLAAAVAGAYDLKGSVQYIPCMVQATCSLLNFSCNAQFPAHSNASLQLMIRDLKMLLTVGCAEP